MNTDAICIDRDTLGNLLDLLLRHEWFLYSPGHGHVPDAYVCRTCGAIGEHCVPPGEYRSQSGATIRIQRPSPPVLTPRVHKPECEMDRAIKALREALAGKLAQLPVPEQKESDDHAGAE